MKQILGFNNIIEFYFDQDNMKYAEEVPGNIRNNSQPYKVHTHERQAWTK